MSVIIFAGYFSNENKITKKQTIKSFKKIKSHYTLFSQNYM